MKKWFGKAVHARSPNHLGSWSKSQSPETRRRNALSSRPSNWNLHTKRLSVARALTALANVTKDPVTKMKARADANYFFRQL